MKKTEGNDALRQAVLRHIDDLDRAKADALQFLEQLDRGPDPRDLQVLEMIQGLLISGAAPPVEAVLQFLRHMGSPQPRWVISRALILERAQVGKLPEKSVNQAITTNVSLGKLAEPEPLKDGRGPSEDSIVGLPEMFGR